MTAPGATPPEGSYRTGAGHGQDKTEQSIRNLYRNEIVAPFAQGQNNLWGSGGFLGFLTQGIFGIIGGVADFIGGLLGVKNKVNNVADVQIPRLDNRIDDVSSGGVSAVRASFFQDGTWTKPTGYSRHIVDVIGGGSGGARRFSDSSVGGRIPGGFSGGWTQIEFFDSDLPATVAASIGLGGAGATEDVTRGAAGGQSDFGVYASAGGALATAHGFGNKTLALRGGHGWGDAAPTAGTGHAYANGGAAGVAGDSAAASAGGDGNRPTPNTLPYPGTGGGGGHGKLGVGNGGRGGNGGSPGGAGGGGGNFRTAGIAGNGGNGAPGAIFVTSYK